ncbi:TPA: hypothetical protein ACFP4Y_000610 [Neisseria bacilliformis]|jgi:conserved domain protein|uniref:hypothetical protein n=1 Tax=Neisseria bacilliformis TaxID=267212 RepID=UPI000669A57F|nr:hypothetical protein [Neisseria bacilliformis]
MTTMTLDDRVSEFETRADADDYGRWLHEKIREARQSPVVSHEEAQAHFAAKRAERLGKLSDAS